MLSKDFEDCPENLELLQVLVEMAHKYSLKEHLWLVMLTLGASGAPISLWHYLYCLREWGVDISELDTMGDIEIDLKDQPFGPAILVHGFIRYKKKEELVDYLEVILGQQFHFPPMSAVRANAICTEIEEEAEKWLTAAMANEKNFG